MDARTILFVVAAVFVLDAFVVIPLIKRRLKAARQGLRPHFQWLAEQLGLQVVGGEPVFPNIGFLSFITRPFHLEGTYRELPLRIHHWASRSGNRRGPTHANARLTVPNPKKLTLHVYREGLMSKVGKALGMQDVQTGDARFDGCFVVKSGDPEFIKTALLPEIRQRFLEIWERHKPEGNIRLENDELFYDELGTIGSEPARERFAAVCELLGELSGVVLYYNR